MASLEQELATARNWIDVSSEAGRRNRGHAALLLAALWYLSLNDRDIYELLEDDHEEDFEELIFDLRAADRRDDLLAAEILGRAYLRHPDDRHEIFRIVQTCISPLAQGQSA
jgi:hypothetical protein